MQPSLLIEHPNTTTSCDMRNDSMTAPATALANAPASSPAALALRLAQRAFAAVIDNASSKGADHGTFRGAQLRRAARRTLSALSADDRPRLNRWLFLQLAAGVAPDSARASRWLARMDARLGANIGTTIAQVRNQLSSARENGAAA